MYIVAGKIFKKRFGKRAMSPVISTVIMTGAMVALLSITLVFANSFLWSRIAESDFNSAKQLMKTIGLQIDDVAWTVGRTQTTQYSSRYGETTLLSSALNYTVYVNTKGNDTYKFSYPVGVLLFNIPISKYSVGNDYYELIFPSQNDTLTLTGTSAPVIREFAAEKLPMGDGSYLRVVVAPCIRSLNSTITMLGNSTYYVKLYLPVLTQGSAPRLTQSVTVTGNSVEAKTVSNVDSINVTVSFPSSTADMGFDGSFFKFPTNQVIDIPEDGYENSVLEFFVGGVTVEFGTN
jgi:hypothetical protein